MDREKKINAHKVEKKYYKPHFGPEETDDTILNELKRSNMQKYLINKFLNYQIEAKRAEKQAESEIEKKKDLQNIETCNKMFLAEEKLMHDKRIQEK